MFLLMLLKLRKKTTIFPKLSFSNYLIMFAQFLIFFLYSNLEIRMKGQMYRLANQTKIHETIESNEVLTELLDNRLYYLNRSFENNLKIQEIYLDVIKNKKTIHAKELKEYYHIFTNSKAESVMFDHQIHNQNDNFEVNQNNKDMVYALKRVYCRLIEKIMVKISYYLMNKPSFNFVYSHTSQLIKRCETLMRRLNNFKDFSNLNEIIQRIFQQNQEFQQYIFHELINKGYINSVDEFYRINGIDVEHRDVYQRNKDTQDEESDSQAIVQKKVKFKAKYQSNLHKDLITSCMKKQSKIVGEPKNQIPVNNRAGMIQLQAKYKDLIVTLDKIISQEQFEEIAQVKEPQENQKDEIAEQISQPNIVNSPPKQQQSQLQRIDEVKIEIQNNFNLAPTVPFIRNLSQSKTTNLRKEVSKKTSQIMSQQYDTRSQLHKQEITIQSLNSSSMIPDTNRSRSRNPSRKYTSPYFSKSFVNAIKSIEKSSLLEQPNRLSIKRMSEHIIQFHRQSEKQSVVTSQKSSKQKMTMMDVLKKSNQKKSIIKLLNIYKNRTLENYIGEARKQLIETQNKFTERLGIKKKQTRYEKRNQNDDGYSRTAQPQYLHDFSMEGLTKLKDDPVLKRKVLRNQTKQSIFKQQSNLKYKHLGRLSSKLKQNIDDTSRTENLLKNYQHIESKIKIPNKSSIFQNFRLSQKLPISNNFKLTQRQNSSLRTSPQKGMTLQSTSILTSNGISSIDVLKYNKDKPDKLNKTVQISPTQTPLFPHFQVYDRIRRVMIK